MSTPTPPGWFPDPYGSAGLERYWDGEAWTQATQPLDEEPWGEDAGFLPPLAGPSNHDSPPYSPPGYGSHTAQRPQPGTYGVPYAGQAGPEATRAKSNRGLLWALGGGAGFLVIVLIAVGVVIGLRDPAEPSPRPPSPTSRRPAPTLSATGGTTSGAIGRIVDSKAGLSYSRLGSPWTNADGNWFAPGLFTAGQVAIVQAPFEQYASFNATSLSGVPRPDESSGYPQDTDLSTVNDRVTKRILKEHFAFTMTRTDLTSRASSVGGRLAWTRTFRLAFTDAKARGWKFSGDTVAIKVIDLGAGRLGLLFVSVPDTFADQGDVDLVLASVQVP